MTKPTSNDAQAKDTVSEVETTGHNWDGITELNNPLPRWWVLTFYGTIIWAIGYCILMPAWPTITGHTKGLLGASDRHDVGVAVRALEASRAPMLTKLHATPLQNVAADKELSQFAQEAGRVIFAQNCSTCHGAGGQGAKGYPSLVDDVWLWDGSLQGIRTTLEYGIRTDHPNTRFNQMPAYGRDKLLEPAQIRDVTNYVLSLASMPSDQAAAARGAAIYTTNCVACHGPDGKGDMTLGAPNLTDKEWLYGGTPVEIEQQIYLGRGGVMPTMSQRLDPASLDAVTIYVHSLGGGT
ncbi:cytochrome-c oxidase, cbb3-type subunit III [Candidatus Phycosocius spiralis]|uniref:Cbb3-type cytochrome c oxidase subunit n=1 Tax=Candidatus Phycosocius spiralis TaxID=2815099 RepID=A0ABQ4PU99_9PROT|nr:cytochrome-c oxidase, cbb3-type subunit III [Candidatus Phycosocius spiralis]GIU66554.1 Cbb3-type cytochrome c oxidase subunit [Candidatus Phycosocius spiralis]